MDAIPFSAETGFAGDAALATLRDALQPWAQHPLLLAYGGRRTQPGYHVTEIKAGSFMTIDCGGTPDSWREIVLQVEDLPASPSTPQAMPVGKFLAILDKVAARIPLDPLARLTFEIGPPGAPMQIFDVEALEITSDAALLRLCARPAICKPRHRAAAAATGCC